MGRQNLSHLDQSHLVHDGKCWRLVDVVRLLGRERHVLELLGKGLEVAVIATRVGMRTTDASNMCTALVEKLGAQDVAHLRSISVGIFKARKHESS